MLYAKTRRKLLQLVRVIQKPHTTGYICKTLKTRQHLVKNRVKALTEMGVHIKQCRSGNDANMLEYVLSQPLADAIKAIERQPTDRKSTRAPTALKKPSGAPWFVLTDNCINIYKREI